MGIQAFALSVPLGRLQPCRSLVSRHPKTERRAPSRATTRACLPSSGEEASPATSNQPSFKEETGESVTKTEQIAALLGQSKATMMESADKVKKQTQLDNRIKYGLALASTVIATCFFLVEKLNPNSGVSLLRFLESTSAPLSAVGTNNNPSFIEFGATWCENCRLTAKSVFELEKKYAGQINFIVVDGDDPKNAEIVERFGVDGIPQFSMVGRDGTVKANLIGRIPKQILAEDLDALLSDKPLPFPGLSLQDLFSSES